MTLSSQSCSQPLVFLDFDDVICLNTPYGCSDVFAPDRPVDLWARLISDPAIQTLKVLVDEFDPRFVITSSWLRMKERDGFEQLFEKCELQFIVSRLREAWEAPQASGMTRLRSIEQWLERNHSGQPFVVLDDSLSGTDLEGLRLYAEGRVVLCEVNEGLRPGHLLQVRRALQAGA